METIKTDESQIEAVKRLKIVKLKEPDASAFSKLAKLIILESSHHSDFLKMGDLRDYHPKKVKANLKNKNILIIAAKYNGKLIGFIRGFFDGGVDTGIFWLHWIGTDKDYRGNNIATKMLDYLADLLRKSYKAHKIMCVLNPENQVSIQFFKKNKYQNIAFLKKYWYKEDFLMWCKDI